MAAIKSIASPRVNQSLSIMLSAAGDRGEIASSAGTAGGNEYQGGTKACTLTAQLSRTIAAGMAAF
jgi:hypothetical protein